MKKYTFATQEGKAYYYNSIPGFLEDTTNNIIGQLVRHSFEENQEQVTAWEKQIGGLQDQLKAYGVDGDIIFEYDIVRLGKRIDVILLIKHIVFSLEYKNGKKVFVAKDAQQAEDYAIDIKNFHKESEDLYVCPILVATDAPKKEEDQIKSYPDKQIYLQKENSSTLLPKIVKVADKYGDEKKIDFEKWFNSPYYPTPTIIAAAIEAYNTHNLSEIAHSEAGQSDIDKCEQKLYEIVEKTKHNGQKSICFVTGVPGAGKTLVGLDLVAKNLAQGKDRLSVYLSGNGPLVEVLREALKESTKENKTYNKQTQEAINGLIQSSFAFKRDNARHNRPTPENILIFDEAQRVWDQKKMAAKHKRPDMNISESYLLYKIMDRHDDWAVMVCLVGLGQDIYSGEVGINEWFRCGIEDFSDWQIYYSPEIFNQTEDNKIDRNLITSCDRCHEIKELNLKTSIRSFRADKQSVFVDSLLDNNPTKACEVYNSIKKKYPIYVSRDLKEAKKWTRAQVRGSQRCGIIASSGAKRLMPEGIYVPKDINVKKWFLAPNDDIRSSNMMEVVASEFKIQGLEIDWALVCWDADLRRGNDNKWDYYNFRGSKWQKRRKENDRRYLINSYRVLLTRARQGMVIFVPKGVDAKEDVTRNHEYYDAIYQYLLDCGIEKLPNSYT